MSHSHVFTFRCSTVYYSNNMPAAWCAQRGHCKPYQATHTRVIGAKSAYKYVAFPPIQHRRWSRIAVTQVGIGMCGLVAFVCGPCPVVEGVPNTRPGSALPAERRLSWPRSYRRANRLRPETEQALVLSSVGVWITCLRLVHGNSALVGALVPHAF